MKIRLLTLLLFITVLSIAMPTIVCEAQTRAEAKILVYRVYISIEGKHRILTPIVLVLDKSTIIISSVNSGVIVHYDDATNTLEFKYAGVVQPFIAIPRSLIEKLTSIKSFRVKVIDERGKIITSIMQIASITRTRYMGYDAIEVKFVIPERPPGASPGPNTITAIYRKDGICLYLKIGSDVITLIAEDDLGKKPEVITTQVPTVSVRTPLTAVSTVFTTTKETIVSTSHTLFTSITTMKRTVMPSSTSRTMIYTQQKTTQYLTSIHRTKMSAVQSSITTTTIASTTSTSSYSHLTIPIIASIAAVIAVVIGIVLLKKR